MFKSILLGLTRLTHFLVNLSLSEREAPKATRNSSKEISDPDKTELESLNQEFAKTELNEFDTVIHQANFPEVWSFKKNEAPVSTDRHLTSLIGANRPDSFPEIPKSIIHQDIDIDHHGQSLTEPENDIGLEQELKSNNQESLETTPDSTSVNHDEEYDNYLTPQSISSDRDISPGGDLNFQPQKMVQYPRRNSAVKVMKMHGMRSMKKGVKVPIGQQVDDRQRPILSRSKVKEGIVPPSSAKIKKNNKLSVDPTRVKQLEANIKIGHEQSERKKLFSHTEPQKTTLENFHEQVYKREVPQTEQPVIAPKNKSTKSAFDKTAHGQLEDQDLEDLPPPKIGREQHHQPAVDILLLSEPVNQNLADFARDRYIDYDEVLVSRIKGDQKQKK